MREKLQIPVKAAWEEFESFCQSGLRLVAVTRAAFARAAQLIRQARSTLRAGDALHLAMVMETGSTVIVTADGHLEKGALVQGISVHRL